MNKDKYTKLIEKCSNVIQICDEIQRFGDYSYNHNDEKTLNKEILIKEINGMLCIICNEINENLVVIDHSEVGDKCPYCGEYI